MPRRILIVDDERMSRLLTESVLEVLGFQADAVGDGRGAVDAAATGAFEAILMDCQMPQMDGFKATAAIRRRERDDHRPPTPIIGLSARDMEGDDEVAMAKGMDGYIAKPVTIRKMRAALDQLGIPVGEHRAS
jgi:CheY-like chemotaxis protein